MRNFLERYKAGNGAGKKGFEEPGCRIVEEELMNGRVAEEIRAENLIGTVTRSKCVGVNELPIQVEQQHG